jgi:hypothetical protein
MMKSESNGDLDVNDITNDTANKYVKKNVIGITHKKTEWERRSPEYKQRKLERRAGKRKLQRLERLNLSLEEYNEYKVKTAVEKKLRDERRILRNSPEHKAQVILNEKSRKRLHKAKQRKINYFTYMVRQLRKRIKNCYPITKLDLYRIAKQQKLICPLTSRKLHRGNISLDHIKTVSAGGTNHPSNLRFVHHDANIARNTLPDEELYKLALDIVETMTPQINA